MQTSVRAVRIDRLNLDLVLVLDVLAQHVTVFEHAFHGAHAVLARLDRSVSRSDRLGGGR